jgi:hypothetical protein
MFNTVAVLSLAWTYQIESVKTKEAKISYDSPFKGTFQDSEDSWTAPCT